MLLASRQFIGKKALIIQPGALGDTILTLPLVELLRHQLGIEYIDIMGHMDYISVFHNATNFTSNNHNSLFNRLLSIDQAPISPLFSNHQQFDLPENHQLIDLLRPYEIIISFLDDPEHNFERNLIYTCSLTHAAEVITININPPDNWPGHVTEYFIQQINNQLTGMQLTTDTGLINRIKILPPLHHLHRANEILKSKQLNPNKPIITIHPGSGGKHKCYPIKQFRQLILQCRKHFGQVVVIIGPAEKDRWAADILNKLTENATLLADLPIEHIAAIIATSKGYIGNDSGISHLAGTLGTPAVAIFGPTNPKHYKPMGNKVSTVPSNNDRWPEANDIFAALQKLCPTNNDNN